VPVTYASLKNKDIDVFLGNWMPTMEADIAPYREDGSVETLVTNLEGAKYTLAVPKYAYDAGLKDRSPTSPSSRTSSAARSTASSPAMTATA
jgi:ABC-type proline/glycine betaine transport system substrate-binding protein